MNNRFWSTVARLGAVCALALAAPLAACSQDRSVGNEGGAGGGGGGANAPDTHGGGPLAANPGKTVPAHAQVEVIWSVSSGSPDYAYAFGSGEASGGTYTVSLPDPPPAEALNSYGTGFGDIGVGIIVLLPDGTSVPAGKVSDATMNDIETKAIGGSAGYAIIYKGAGASKLSWSSLFPDGYSCAKGVPAKPGETFDTLEPVDCSEVVITVDSLNNLEFNNWG